MIQLCAARKDGVPLLLPAHSFRIEPKRQARRRSGRGGEGEAAAVFFCLAVKIGEATPPVFLLVVNTESRARLLASGSLQ